jgi:PmbA protein
MPVEKGATACEVDASEGFGQSVGVRCDEVETIEFNRDKGIGITIYSGQRKGYASTSDFSAQALRETVEAALNIARFTAEDDCAGLADAALMAKDCPDLDLYHPWALTVEDAIETARRCEQAAFRRQPADQQFGRRFGFDAAGAFRLGQQPRLHGRLPDLAPLHFVLGDCR